LQRLAKFTDGPLARDLTDNMGEGILFGGAQVIGTMAFKAATKLRAATIVTLGRTEEWQVIHTILKPWRRR